MIQRLAPFALILGSVLAVVACSEPTPPPEPPAPPPAPVLGGVSLDQPVRVLGTEPFWGVTIAPTGLTYDGVDRPEQTAPNPGPIVQGTVATYTATTTAGTPLSIVLMATECSDGMSDRTYPLTARVEIGGETLNGCAIQSAALAALPPA